ncbi:MAG: polysaccharide deacetylase [Propionibacteriaceae bacterium]|jgi:peptidoglycan/xylan/chitin deacetylase (PgdA/CDA1 family)|nr:polysaccharide deacetylase [Propionibacteriaceae bacterium]
MADKEILVAYGVDLDAVGGWLGSYGSQSSTNTISRGLFAGEVGVPRLIKLFDTFDLPSTWFWPGQSVETFPEQFDRCAASGAEIGLHGYSHENLIAMTRRQEADILDYCIDLVVQRTGRAPTGYVAPWWELSTCTGDLLCERGIIYDHSLMHQDFEPHYVRLGDTWTTVNYDQPAATWMKPLDRGRQSCLVEIAASWYLDDLPPMMFIKGNPNSFGFVTPRQLETLWMDQFDWVYREYDYAIFPMTIHPDVSGRPQVLLMHERLIQHISRHEGVRWVTFDEIARDFLARCPRTA